MTYENENAIIHFSDSRNMTEVINNSVALVVTSPPCFNFVEYGNTASVQKMLTMTI